MRLGAILKITAGAGAAVGGYGLYRSCIVQQYFYKQAAAEALEASWQVEVTSQVAKQAFSEKSKETRSGYSEAASNQRKAAKKLEQTKKCESYWKELYQRCSENSCSGPN